VCNGGTFVTLYAAGNVKSGIGGRELCAPGGPNGLPNVV
jgi:hypothetical protein